MIQGRSYKRKLAYANDVDCAKADVVDVVAIVHVNVDWK